MAQAAQTQYAASLVNAARLRAQQDMMRPLPGQRHGMANTILGNKPVAKALHFKNAAARAKAQRKLNAIPAGTHLTQQEIHALLIPFLREVPVFRGVPTRYRREYRQYFARMDARAKKAATKENKDGKKSHPKTAPKARKKR